MIHRVARTKMAVVGAVLFELHIPGARSLKDKRRTIRSLIDRMARRHRISISETGFQDLRQRSQIAIAVVAKSPVEVERILDQLRDAADNLPEALVSDWQQEILELS